MLRAVCPPLWHGGQPLKCRACGGGVYTDARDEELSYWTEDDVNVTVYRDPAVERAFRKKFQRYRSVLPAAGGTLLEVGCGAGLFLAWGASQGWNMRGLDISSHAIALSQEACRKADLFCGTIDEAHYPAQSVNGVVLWDVIEHVQSPEMLLKAVARILTPRGFVLLETPDEGCLPRRLIRGAYTLTRGRINALPYLYYPAHKWYYTRNAMRLALSRTGFEHISFYRERTVGELAVRKRRHYHAAPSFSHKVSHAVLEAVSIVPVLRNKMVVVAYKAPMVGDRSRLSP
jgi:2-polyprenyl-3-methyl-5-hydroxy-6-metoxy-1,4-benzoquinol methylase